jgi:hypothetical protein
MTKHGMWRAVAGLATVALLAGCGGGDDEAATGGTTEVEETTSGGDAQPSAENAAYCELARELDEQESFPTVEQLDELAAAAPEEIRDDVEFVVGKFKEGIEAGDPARAFGDPEVEQRFEPIEAFEAGECGLGTDEEEPEQDPAVTQLDPAAARVDVTATEYDFAFDPPAAGRTSLVMTNEGEESHVMLVARLAEGATLDDALQADDPAEFVEEEYDSGIAVPGEEAVVTAELTPGEWAMVCYLPAPDGQAHFEKGMAETFTVE